ncbi:sensor domain-containing protein [Crossiella sp. CA-258035]|uniref:sensor histidine kinase n=1 Tax=Crossiella sp. CA-258035 TaxID=2981138 RepID=UPI0024BCA575|nr:sensor domain-containing protein [Crossiella sp. CA-258035]WHT15791.1 sensor domain-containing protein [Crossiella sp. CA-258035]
MAVAHRVGRFALLSWTIPLLVYAALGMVLFGLVIASFALYTVWLGLPMSVLCFAVLRGYNDLHRRWAGAVLGVRIGRPYRLRTNKGFFRLLRHVMTDPASWRDFAWLPLNLVASIAACSVTLALFFAGLGGIVALPWFIWPFLPDGASFSLTFWTIDSWSSAFFVGTGHGIVYLALWYIGSQWIFRGYASLARMLLAPTEKTMLVTRVRELSESRADAVDTQAAELRRIERDLHDGAQARMVAMGMSLGMAEQLMAKDPQAAQELLAEARQANTQALAELRDLVRGIHPPVLADRGLAGAVQALVMANPLPTDVEIELPGRLPAPVESAAYFAVAEALTNVVKHSGAAKAWVRLTHSDGQLHVLVGDDGHGGADASGGTGLRGIERRLSAFDGRVMVTSPPGGPTVVVMDLPCEPVPSTVSGDA